MCCLTSSPHATAELVEELKQGREEPDASKAATLGGHHRRVQCGEVQPSDQRAGLQAPWSELEKHLWAAEQGRQPGWSGQLPKFFSWRDAGRSTGRTGPSWYTAHSYQPTWSCWGGKEEAFREASEVQNTEVNHRLSVILCWFISNKVNSIM